MKGLHLAGSDRVGLFAITMTLFTGTIGDRTSTVVAVALLSGLVIACSGDAGAPGSSLALGVWGGDGIRLETTADSATIEFDCAHGSIGQPLTLGQAGRVSATGTYVIERGVIQVGQPPDSHPARYDGQLSGMSVTLDVTLLDTARTVGPFSATLDAAPRLTKCL